MRRKNVSERDFFMAHVDKCPITGCWIWAGSKTSNGYGKFIYGKQLRRAHRAAVEIFTSADVTGRVVCHRCKNRLCVNPDHLRADTQVSNMQEKTDHWRDFVAAHPDIVQKSEEASLRLREAYAAWTVPV